MAELDAGLENIRRSPADEGRLDLIVRRPAENEREVLEIGKLTPEDGLVGDNWRDRGSTLKPADPDRQLNIMNARTCAHIAGTRERWPLAGDQLYVDFDLSETNTPAGTLLAVGEAVVEVTDKPHNGCKKFADRYGVDAVKWVNSPEGKSLHLRGICARTVKAGMIRSGDVVRKMK